MIHRFRAWFDIRPIGRRNPICDGLLRADRFQEVLSRERLRADRTGSSFSLVVVGSKSDPAAMPAALSIILRERLRETDSAGYVETDKVGVLLTDTDRAGAEILVSSIRSKVETAIDFEIEIHVYPTDGEATNDLSAGAETGNEDFNTKDNLSMEPLFAKSLPLWKRSLDIAGSIACLVILSPLLFATAVAIRLTSKGPILFAQWRTGRGGKPFRVFKFRTMCVDAEEKKATLMSQNEQDGPAFKIKNDPRITTVGRYLRRSCVDELPQLWNVLRGDMTLVGPRPLPCNEADQCEAWARRRQDVTPGLTCIWQVDGRRVAFSDWMRMDIRYINMQRLHVDATLLWRTFLKVLMHKASC